MDAKTLAELNNLSNEIELIKIDIENSAKLFNQIDKDEDCLFLGDGEPNDNWSIKIISDFKDLNLKFLSNLQSELINLLSKKEKEFENFSIPGYLNNRI